VTVCRSLELAIEFIEAHRLIKERMCNMRPSKIFFLAALLASGSANSAALEEATGDVWIGREDGFASVHGSAEVSPGDRIKVGRKGGARLVYPDGCSVAVQPHSLTRVSKHSPCSFNAQVIDPSTGPGSLTTGQMAAVGFGLLGAAGGGIAAGLASGGGTQVVPFPVFIPATPPVSNPASP
jgi:hypothetical protein